MAVDYDVEFRSTPIMVLNDRVKRKDLRLGLVGNTGGHLSGDYPDGITKIDGVPGPAIIRILVRSIDPFIDGMIVAQTVSGIDGTWRVEGLDSGLRYDVVCRKGGFNDMILSDVSPAV